jgi:HTH-type transcriptional regulator, transcriptional repressor of NAD biosynthesis genes
MIKIILTGPESCGKTTLARQLATHFNVPLVEEYVRDFFEKKGTPEVSGQAPQYQEADLKDIAIGQIKAENEAESAFSKQLKRKNQEEVNQFLICDTDVLTIKIWAEEKYGRCDELILGSLQGFLRLETSNFKLQTLYLLCSPEGIEWEADPLRENPNDRERLFTVYERNLIFYQKSYFILRGSISERFELAKDILLALSV